MSQYISNPGIAAATGTRVDSSSKHTMACRVNEPLMLQWCTNQQDGRNYVHQHKNKFCVHKNELVLNTSQPLNMNGTIMHNCKAYPAVVSNLGEMTITSRNVLQWLYHFSPTGHQFMANKLRIRKEFVESVVETKDGNNPCVGHVVGHQRVIGELKNMPYFTAQGYALGQAWASQLSGDTVSTVLIGGMQTVMNGHFECRAGQMLQWYFDFEAEMFCQDIGKASGINKEVTLVGMRKVLPGTADALDTTAGVAKVEALNPYKASAIQQDRKRYNDRELGALDGMPLGGKSEVKSNIVLPKPYMLRSDGGNHYGDHIRIFAKCISGARPHEMMDLMLMTQSL